MYIHEMSDSDKFLTEAVANNVGRNRVKIKPNDSQSRSREKAVNFLEKLSIKDYTTTFEIVYNSEKNLTEFQMTYPEKEENDFRSELNEKYPEGRIVNKLEAEPIFDKAEQDGNFIGSIDFDLAEERWLPINGIELSDFNEDPLNEIIREITKNGSSTVDVMFQVRFKPLNKKELKLYTSGNIFESWNGFATFFNEEPLANWISLFKRLYKISSTDKIKEYNLKQDKGDVESGIKKSAIEKKHDLDSNLYTVNISVVAVSKDEEKVRELLSNLSERIEVETEDKETGQKLQPNAPRNRKQLFNKINPVLTERLTVSNSLKRFLKKTPNKPCVLSHTSLAELVHISNSDISDKTIDTANVEDDGKIPSEAPSFE